MMQKVLIFGRGYLFKKKEMHIKKKFEIVGFLDNKVQTGIAISEKYEIPVYNPQMKEQYMTQDTKILLMSYQYPAMWKQLYELGIDGEKVLFGIEFPPYSEREAVLFEEGGFMSVEKNNVIYNTSSGEIILIEDHKETDEIARRLLREKYRKKYPVIAAIAHMDTKPVSSKFGLERGKAIDRYYIEHFIEKNRELIHGDCLEIAEDTYTKRYGEDRVNNVYILHIEGWGQNAIKGNLETGEGIDEGQYDCAIITQTLMFIFDFRKASENIYIMLKKGGNALITVSGISQISRYDADLWGSYYGFHEDTMRAVFEPLFGKENVLVETYGNCKIALAMLCGLCQEDLPEEDFKVKDQDYPVIISVLLHKES